MKKLLLLLFLPILFSCNKKDQTKSDNIKTNKKNILLIEKIKDTTATNLNKKLYSRETLNKYFSSAKEKEKNGNLKEAISEYYKLRLMVNNSVLDDKSKTELTGLIYYFIGESKYKLKDYIGAISSYNMVIELISEQDSLYHMAIFNRGMSYYLQDDDYLYFKAIEDFTSVIELPQFSMLSEAYYFRGAAKYRVFDRDGACEDFKKSNDLDNSSNTEIFSFCAD